MAKWRESAPLGPAAAPPRPGVGCEGSAPLARPWAHVGVRGPRGRPQRAREGRPPSLYPLIHVAAAFFWDDAPVRRGLAMSAAAPAPCLACISRHHGQHSCSRRRSFATLSPVERSVRQRPSPAATSAAASTSPKPTPERRAAGRAGVTPAARRDQAAAPAKMSLVAARRAAARSPRPPRSRWATA